MKTKVFVSSTYIDLKSYREKIWEVLSKYDVELRGMEEFGARSDKPLDTCIKEVLVSDIYIGIIGIRYGSVDEETGKSFTQLEYEAAVEDNMEVMIYLLDEENSKVSPAHIDYKNIENLNNFKTLLKEKHTIDTFSSEDELAQKINKRLNKITKDNVVVRPKIIEAKVFRFSTDKRKYIAIVGYLNQKPFEVWITDDDGFYLPAWVKSGLIIKESPKDERIRYDFKFPDKEGYEMIYQGLSRSWPKISYDFAIHLSKLYQTNISVDELISLIKTIPYNDDDSDQFKKGIQNIIDQT